MTFKKNHTWSLSKFFVISILLLLNNECFACNAKLKFYTIECQLADRYSVIINQYKDKNLNIENIAIYKALRFIDRKSYERAQVHQTPIEKIYKPAPLTWLTWNKGVLASEVITEKISENILITIEDIKNLHKSTMLKSLMTKTSRYLKGSSPGKFRSHFWQRAPEFTFSCNEKNGQDVANLINNYDLKTTDEKPLISGSVNLCSDGHSYSGHVIYLNSRKVLSELNRWLSEFNEYINNYNNLIINKESPIVFIADMQRRFVSIHPFGDGNGRISRLLQDAFLKALELPYPVSADLSQDLFMNQDLYRATFQLKIEESLDNLQKCLNRNNQAYDCQIVPSEVLREPASFFSAPKNPAHSFERPTHLAKESFVNKHIKSCYRWMSKHEYRKWIKNNEPIFYEIQHIGDHLRRGGLTEKGIYCWENTIGALAGGITEIYGEQLVRIDFADNTTLYDRNQNEYFNISNNNFIVADENKKGIDSDVFYANYWFQEYIIKSPKAIKGWSFGDTQLKAQLKNDLDKFLSKQLLYKDFHFSISYCPLDRNFYSKIQLDHCDMYLNLAKQRYNNLMKFWQHTPESTKYFINFKN